MHIILQTLIRHVTSTTPSVLPVEHPAQPQNLRSSFTKIEYYLSQWQGARMIWVTAWRNRIYYITSISEIMRASSLQVNQRRWTKWGRGSMRSLRSENYDKPSWMLCWTFKNALRIWTFNDMKSELRLSDAFIRLGLLFCTPYVVICWCRLMSHDTQ